MMKRKKTSPFKKIKLVLLGTVVALLAFLAFVEIDAPTRQIVVEIPLNLDEE